MSTRTEIFLTSAKPKTHALKSPDPEQPMRILVMGAFGGFRGQTLDMQADQYRIHKVDIDNFEPILASIRPILKLSLDDSLPDISVEFEDLDDFHPDNLFRKIGIFSQFSKIRQKLVDPARVREGAEELQQLLNLSRAEQRPTAEAATVETEDDQQTLSRLLGESPTGAGRGAATKGEQIALGYIKQVVAEHIVEDVSPFQDIYIKAVDDAISVLMRKLLHHPDFQALEAAWRSLNLLVAGLETDETLSLHLLDIGKDDLRRDLLAEDRELAATPLYRQLVTQAGGSYGGEPWSVLVGNYAFTDGDDDLALLAALGCIASHAGGPFISAAEPTLLGCSAWPEKSDYHDWTVADSQTKENWRKLRESAVAPYIGLTFPRILLRMPYGDSTDPIDSFQFEEMGSETGHEDFLWGNAAFHCALLIGRTFCEQGWDMQLGDYLEISDLPAYIEPQGDENRLKPCAEVCISDRTMEKILEAGVMPFVSHRNMNLVRLTRFQSIGDPLQNLRAAWNRF